MLETELNHLLALEEYYWKQRVRVVTQNSSIPRQLLETRRMSTVRSKKNAIRYLLSPSGEKLLSKGAIIGELECYLEAFFPHLLLPMRIR